MNKQLSFSVKDILLLGSVFFSMFFYTIQGSDLYNNSMKIFLAISILFSVGYVFYSFLYNKPKGYVKFGICYIIITSVMMYMFLKVGNDTRKMFFPLAILIGFFASEEKLIKYLFYSKLLAYSLVFVFGSYGHINGLALHGGILLILYFCYVYDKMDLKRFSVIIFAYLLLILLTDSGAVKIGIGLLILLYLLNKVELFNKILMSKAISFSFAFALLINVFLCLCYDEKEVPVIGSYLPESVNSFIIDLAKVLNKYTTGRIELGKFSLESFGISLLGGNVDYFKLDRDYYFNLDSGMLWLLQGWGIILTILVVFLFTFMLWQMIKYKKTQYVLVTIVIICWGLNEEMLFSIGTNFMIYFIGTAIRYAFDENVKNKFMYTNFIKKVFA